MPRFADMRITMKRSLFCILPLLLAPAAGHAEIGDPLAFFTSQNNVPASTGQPTAAPVEPAAAAAPSRIDRHLGPASSDVAKLAEEMGVPRALALAVCRVESHCRYGVSGPGGVHGPLQIKPQTARGLGFNGSAAALRGYQGAYYGVKHLAIAYKKCGNAAGAAKLHQAGLRANCGRSGYSAKVASFM